MIAARNKGNNGGTTGDRLLFWRLAWPAAGAKGEAQALCGRQVAHPGVGVGCAPPLGAHRLCPVACAGRQRRDQHTLPATRSALGLGPPIMFPAAPASPKRQRREGGPASPKRQRREGGASFGSIELAPVAPAMARASRRIPESASPCSATVANLPMSAVYTLTGPVPGRKRVASLFALRGRRPCSRPLRTGLPICRPRGPRRPVAAASGQPATVYPGSLTAARPAVDIF